MTQFAELVEGLRRSSAPSTFGERCCPSLLSSDGEFAPEYRDEELAVKRSAPFHTIRLALPGMKAKAGAHHQHGV